MVDYGKCAASLSGLNSIGQLFPSFGRECDDRRPDEEPQEFNGLLHAGSAFCCDRYNQNAPAIYERADLFKKEMHLHSPPVWTQVVRQTVIKATRNIHAPVALEVTRSPGEVELRSDVLHIRMEKKQSKMSKPSYQALLQSLDENDVSRGLGRSIKIRKRTGGCCRCCGPSIMWTCIVLLILIGLVLSIGIPLILSSSLPWRQWLHLNFTDWTSSTVTTSLNHNVSTDQTAEQTTAHVPLAEDQTMSELNSTINSETPQVTQPSFVQRANEWIHQFIQLTVILFFSHQLAFYCNFHYLLT